MGIQNKTQLQLAIISIALLLGSGCASKSPSFGDMVEKESGQREAISKKWKKGNALLKKGKKQVEKGNEQLKDGRKNVAQGEERVLEGQQLVDEATAEYESLKISLPAIGN